MRRYLVVAHRTLGGAHLLAELQRLRTDDPYCTFHLIVPELHVPATGWDDHLVRVAAQSMLDEMLERLAGMRIGATGEVGASNPVYAVANALRRDGHDHYCGIILSTLPRGISRWLHLDVPRRMAHEFPDIPLTHLVADEALV